MTLQRLLLVGMLLVVLASASACCYQRTNLPNPCADSLQYDLLGLLAIDDFSLNYLANSADCARLNASGRCSQ